MMKLISARESEYDMLLIKDEIFDSNKAVIRFFRELVLGNGKKNEINSSN